MKSKFKTFRCKQTGLFAYISNDKIYTCERPQSVFYPSANMDAAKHFYPESLLKQVELVTVEFDVLEE